LISINSRVDIAISVCPSDKISELVRPTNTKFGINTSYTCTQIKFISNFGCHAPFAQFHNYDIYWYIYTGNNQARDFGFG